MVRARVASKITKKKDDENEPHKSWDFTDHTLVDQEGKVDNKQLALWQRWCGPDGLSFCEIASERGDKGKWHGQGRLITRRAYRRTQLHKLFPKVHFQPTKCQQDCLYLRKHDSVTILLWDDRAPGRRNIFKEQMDAILGGASLFDLRNMEGFNAQAHRSAEILLSYNEPERPPAPRTVIYVRNPTDVPWGPTIYRLQDKTTWAGYDAQKTIYIHQPVVKLKMAQIHQILSPMPFRVGKWGRQARFDTVYIFGLSDEHRKALEAPVKRFEPIDLLVRR